MSGSTATAHLTVPGTVERSDSGDVPSQPAHQHYFRDSIVPRLDSERVFVGPLLGLKRRAFLARARALVVPGLIDATNAVVVMEALACGTPVIAMNRGSVSEIVDHGITGDLCNSVEDMVEAVSRLDSLDRAICRLTSSRSKRPSTPSRAACTRTASPPNRKTSRTPPSPPARASTTLIAR